MATPKESIDIKALVDARLDELNMTKVEFAKRLGYAGYGAYYDLFSSKRTQLTEERLAKIAEVLDWSPERFKDPGTAVKREDYVRETFGRYMRTDVAQARDPDTNKILESMRWNGKFLPTVELYQVVALTMEGRYAPAQLLGAMQLAKEDAEEERRGASPDETHVHRAVKRKR